MRVEIGSQVCDDSVGKAELVQDVADEANHSICRELCDWLVLDPLRKLVDGHQYADANPHLYKLSLTRMYSLLRLRMRVASTLFGSTPGVVCAPGCSR
jgi:hypothetical protein